MKQLYTVLFIALSVGNMLAQQSTETNVLNSRLIATNTERWTSGSWAEQDSTHYTYSGTRGGEYVNSQLFADYDLGQSWYWQGGTPTNANLYERTYDANNRLIQTVIKFWNNAAWTNNTRETTTYGPYGLTDFLSEEWDGSAWVGSYRINYIFDAAGNEITGQRDIWNGTVWVGSTKVFSTYNANNELLTRTTQNYQSSTWRNQYRYFYTLDAAGNILSYTYETWNTGTSAWEPSNRRQYTYNAAGKELTMVLQQYNNGNWEDDDRETRTYNGQGYLTRKLIETYASGTWQNTQRTDYTPNSVGLDTEKLVYSWANGIWNETSRDRSTYDAAGNKLTFVTSTYVSGAWNDQYSAVYTYNAFNQWVTFLYQENFGSGLENNIRAFYYYETYEDGTSGITTLPTLSSVVLPNPFTINVAIQLQVTEAGNHTFEVYNMAGQRVHTESRHLTPGPQTIVWDGQQVPQGVYFYKIHAQSGLASGKLVKQ